MQQVKQKSINISSNNTKQSQCAKPIELEINISIGKNKYVLQVQKCSNLHEQVQQFLKLNKLNEKYEGPILSMVKQQLTKKNKHKQSTCGEIQQLKKIKSHIDVKKKMALNHNQSQEMQQQNQNNLLWNHTQELNETRKYKKQDKQNYSNRFNMKKQLQSQQKAQKNSKQKNIKNPLTQQQLKCQNVYQKWKIKQKIKQQQKVKNSITPNKQSRQKNDKSFTKQQDRVKPKSQKKIQVHQPDFFYNKGQNFKHAKQIHIQNLYKQKYPFQINKQLSLTPRKKTQLHYRLYKQQKVKETFKIEKQIEQKMASKPKTPTGDKYKQKIIQRDNKLNQALGQLLSNKMIENPYKIQKVSKSPFRKMTFN